VVAMMVFYLHLGSFAEFLIADLDQQIGALDHDEVQAKVPRESLVSA
jgi:hypothetical protein